MIMVGGFGELLRVSVFWKAASSCRNVWVVASADVLVELEFVLELLSEAEEAASPWP